MIGKIGLLVTAGIWSVSAAAQDAVQAPALAPAPKPQTASGPTPGTTSAAAVPKYWFQIDLAPEIAQQDPFSSDSEATDSTDVKWTFGLNHNLSKRWDIEARLGAVATVDSDSDSSASSRFVGTLRFRREFQTSPKSASIQWTLRGVARYQLALRYTQFFDDRDGTEHTFDGGLALQIKFPAAELNVENTMRRLESTLVGGDFTSFRLAPRLRLPLGRSMVALAFSGEAERRWYDGIDPAIGQGRRDWRVQGFGGLDLTEAVNSFLDRGRTVGRNLVQEFSIGARLIEIESNVASQERSTLKFAGSLSLRVSLN